jgi:NAD(P)H dehydrogenase (quinone)
VKCALQTQALNTKFTTVFSSTGTQHGGQESTAFTTIPFFAHHGMIFVPIGYKAPELMDVSEIMGGSPFGASTLAGADGSRAVSAKEKTIGETHGKHFAEIVITYAK